MRPHLKPQNYKKRLEFALSKVDTVSMEYDAMENVVVIDEKIFYNDKDKKKKYLVKDEEAVKINASLEAPCSLLQLQDLGKPFIIYILYIFNTS
jgi:hypothetical protein